MKAACIQMRSGLSRQNNIADAKDMITQAAEHGAAFIVTPEMTNIIDRKPRRLFEELPDSEQLPEFAEFAGLAKQLKITLLIGSMALPLNKDFAHRQAANRAFLFDPLGNNIAQYDKIHMFDVDLPNGESWKESAIYRAGDKAVLVDLGKMHLGLTICYDVRFPSLYQALAKQGANVIAVPAAFTRQTGQAHWHSLLRARAIENGVFILAAAQGGTHEDGRQTYGHSLIISPWGEILAEKEDDRPGIIYADLALDEVERARLQIPNLSLETAFEITDIKAV